jgi:hypothetical protein
MTVSSAWFASASIWVFAGVFTVLLSALSVSVTMWIGVRSRREIIYGISSISRVSMNEEIIKKSATGIEGVSDPYITVIYLATHGSKDITSENFDGGKPLSIDIGTRVVSLLEIKRTPEIPVVPVTFEKTAIQVGPGLLSRRQEMEVTALTDGPALQPEVPSLSVHDVFVRLKEFADVDLHPRESVSSSLAERAQVVANALGEATKIVHEIETEVKARAAIIENLVAQANQAEIRAGEAVRRAALSEQQVAAVDAYLNRALQSRIRELELRLEQTERKTRRRDWMIATLVTSTVGLVVGVAAILIAHFWLGF